MHYQVIIVFPRVEERGHHGGTMPRKWLLFDDEMMRTHATCSYVDGPCMLHFCVCCVHVLSVRRLFLLHGGGSGWGSEPS